MQPRLSRRLPPAASGAAFAFESERQAVAVEVPAAEMAGLPAEKLRYDGPDKLPRPPAETREAIEGLKLVEEPYQIADWLIRLVLEGEPDGISKQTSAGVVATLAEDAMEARGVDILRSGVSLRKWLLAPTWEQQAERAMGLYAEGMGLPWESWLPDLLNQMMREVAAYQEKKGPLPDGVSRAIASAYNRLLFYREKYVEIERKELEQEQRRQQQQQRYRPVMRT